MEDNKREYRKLCEKHPEIPLFLQTWWMDAACGDDWNALLSYDKNGGVSGVFVYHYVKKMGRFLIVPATLTQYSGTWLFYPDNLTIESRYSFENETYNDLIGQIDALKPDLFELNFHYSQNYWQPFYWNGFSQTTRYTYRLGNISDLDAVLSGMSHRKRQKPLAKAMGNFELRLNLNAETFYDLYASQLRSEGQKIFYSKNRFLNIHKATSDKGQGQIFSLYSEKEELATALFVVWDNVSAYNLVIYIDDRFRSSGASTLIVYKAIEYLSTKTKNYDFEGSMIHGVALKNQSFGAVLTPFSQISKINNPLLKLWYWAKH
ncbi:MAG: GNAT family N-acetyltransferase [Paludibacteraceae bacterium]|nr:GNAT family N-acetyltransferase [Paludibacteraceae bacterium]